MFIVPMIQRFFGRANGSAEYCKRDVLVAVFEQVVQLSEHFGDVPSVYLIDQEHAGPDQSFAACSAIRRSGPGTSAKLG